MGDFVDAINKIITKLNRVDRRVKNIERSTRTKERNEELSAYDDQDGDDFAYRTFEIYTLEVTSVVSDMSISGQVMIPQSSATTPWIIDPELSSILTVDVPFGSTAPSVGDVVSINFTGTYGTTTPIARFALLSSAGGGGSSEYVVTEVHSSGNFLVCETTVASVDGGSNVYVALPSAFRKSVWDTETILDITYAGTTSDPHFRLATNASSTALKQYEKILPSYNIGDIIVGLQLGHSTTAVATYTDGTTLVSNVTNIEDANNRGRAWVRIGQP